MSEQTTETQSTGEHDDAVASAAAGQADNNNGQGDKAYERAEFQDLASEPGSLSSVEPNLDVILDITSDVVSNHYSLAGRAPELIECTRVEFF